MKAVRCAIALVCALALCGCGGRKASLYGCWQQTEESEAGLIRWNPAGYSEAVPKSDEIVLISRDGWFDVYGAGHRMIHSKYTRRKKSGLILELRALDLSYSIQSNTLAVTALDRKKSVYWKLTPEEKTRFLDSLGDSRPTYSTED